ncbi:hypothetical protein ACJJTC_015682 [Scirpophaga incertulas]
MASRSFKRNADSFCYICGEFIKVREKKYDLSTNLKICEAYQAYFNLPVKNQDKKWTPHVSCNSCRYTLDGWYRGEKRQMKFAVPRIWREPSDHLTDCYFCIVKPLKGKNSKKTSYPDLPSTSAPMPHTDTNPVPNPPVLENQVLSQDSFPSRSSSLSVPSEFVLESELKLPHLINSEDLNDLIRDLNLPKSKAELLASRLKQWNLLNSDVRISRQRKRHEEFSCFFSKEDGLCFCHDVKGLFEEIGIPCYTTEWRLFIDSSTKSLKAVLLHNGNKFPSIPLAHSVRLKENCDSIKMLLTAIKYMEYKWEVIGDFKMVCFLTGMQGGYTKYSCYLCLWDSSAAHYRQKHWPVRTVYEVGKCNIKWEAIVDLKTILMPPLHIKLGLIKQFVKALNHESEAFKYLKNFFPKLSEAKIKAGIFVGPQIKKIMDCDIFPDLLSNEEKNAWNSFKAVVHGFLGNHRAENYDELITDMITNFSIIGCRMSLKMHMLHSHLDKFKNNMGAYSEEQGERFHQDIMEFERRYQGQYTESMMGDYIWGLIRETSTEHERKSKTVHF